jgi:sugar phosphate isomerase/epimerase
MILSSQTIATASFVERLEAAAAAGFAAIGMRPSDYAHAGAKRRSDADLRTLLATYGLEVAEHQALREWVEGPTRAEEELFALADAVEGTYVIATANALPAFDEAARQVDRLATRAAELGLVVALEFMPWSDVRDARTRLELVSACGNSAAGILVDAWHFFAAAARPGSSGTSCRSAS